MRVLMLATDENIFKSGSEAQKRMIEYGNLVDELHIIVYAVAGNRQQATGRISKNVWVYPTNTWLKPFYFFDAYFIGKSILATSYKLQATSWLITAQDPFETGLVGYWLKCKFKLPLQIQIHTDFLSPYFWQESLKNKIRVLLGKWLAKKADCLRVVSDRIKKSLNPKSSILNSRIIVLPIFIDVEKIKSTPIKTDLHKKYPDYNFIILMASRLTREKNIALAIDAMREIVKKYPKALLLIVGDGLERKALHLHATRYTLRANVIFEPWTDDLASYYKTADLFLNTSNYEGYGRTIIEALAASCPVISTDVGIASEIVRGGENGIITPINDMEALVEAIQKIIAERGKFKGFLSKTYYKDKQDYLDQYKKSWKNCAC